MSKHFGKTWWGEQWLQALSNIDYSNRLPRGSRYARNGSILEMVVKENKVFAKVSGSRPTPYRVQLEIPEFNSSDLERFLEDLLDRPALVSGLLNRNLSSDVEAVAKRHNLQIFPREWSDLEMSCSCPDWVVPCKHLAAVVYKLSMEIDNNPFLIFEIHKVDLPKELSKRGIDLNLSEYEVPLLQQLLSKTQKKKIRRSEELTEEGSDVLNLEFSQIEDVGSDLIYLLSDNPAFYNQTSNFKNDYSKSIQACRRNFRKFLDSSKSIAELFPYSVQSHSLIGKRTSVGVMIDHHFKPQAFCNGEETTWWQFLKDVYEVDAYYLEDYQQSLVVFRQLLHLSIHLIAQGAMIPQIVKLSDGSYKIRWLPASISKSVKKMVGQADRYMQSEYLSFTDGKNEYDVDSNRAENLLSIFITSLISMQAPLGRSDLFMEIFFREKTYRFSAPGEESLSGGIQSWLDVFNLSDRKFKPRILVGEGDGELFLLKLQFVNNRQGLSEIIPLQDVFEKKEYREDKYDILRSFSLIGRFIPGMDQYINCKGDTNIVLDLTSFTPFLMEFIPVMRLLDVEILLPKSLQRILRPRPSVKIKTKGDRGKSFFSLDGMLDFDWKVAIGDQIVDVDEFKGIMRRTDGLLKYKSQYIYVDQTEIEQLFKHFERSKTMNGFQILRVALSEEYMGSQIQLTEEVKDLIIQLKNVDAIKTPDHLKATLRPYQERGYSWLYRNRAMGLGSVLADDMGLGKTLQVITALQRWKEEDILDTKKTLVVCPTGLLGNWQAEFQKFAGELHIELFHGSQRKMPDEFDALLTSYGTLRSDVALLKKTKWAVLVIDEAQNIKNVNTAQTKALREISADHRIAMSGTPVENRLSELWSIFDFCNRGILGTPKQFREEYAKAIEINNDRSVAESLMKVTSPFIMRRLKSDKSIISDLPDKIEINKYAHLKKEQAALYRSTLDDAMRAIEQEDTDSKQGLFKRNGLILQMILALKQICNHPTQFLKDKNNDATLSGKSMLLLDTLESIVENHEKVLIFTQFKEMGALLSLFIEERFGEKPLFYHGGCNLKQRETMVQQFQHNRAEKIFLLSLKAAGTGLNLTAANHVIHYDLWWNPAVEAQATDRAYRIGQKSNVMVHRFITKNTFEEKIDLMIQSKKDLANMTVSTGENWIGNLSNKELNEIFRL